MDHEFWFVMIRSYESKDHKERNLLDYSLWFYFLSSDNLSLID